MSSNSQITKNAQQNNSAGPALAPAVEISGLRKVYGKTRKAEAKTALKGVDLIIPRGSIFGLLGPNGAGKSTMINILAGLVVKSEGNAKICGYDIDTQTRQARASIGVVPQEITMDVFFTPFQALELQAGYYGVPKSERRTEEILTALGLIEKRDAYVRQLSGGMKRRLLIGKALVHNPPVLILDEPTAGVDIELRRQLWAYVEELHAKGTTIILTTHYLEEAEALCDKIAIIHNGEIVANDDKSALLSRLDKRTIIISPTAPLSSLSPELLKMGAHIREDGNLAIDYKSGTDSISDVLQVVAQSGISISDLRTEEPDLEDVFMSLTYSADESP